MRFRRLEASLLAAGLALALSVGAGCSDDDGAPADAGVDATADASLVPAIPMEIPCDDAIDDVYGDPGTLPGQKGAILRCAVDAPIPREDLQAAVDAEGFTGTLTSGAQVYRVTYETERGNEDPGYSSALVFVPDTPRADPLPVIVASHGSRGQGPRCAPSKGDAAADWVKEDFEGLVFPLVGAGFAVIAPDLAGYANAGAAGNPPSVYANAEDVGRSTLDGVAALRNLIGSHLSDDVVLTGHSQGGHTALSALAIAEQYGVDGTLAAVVVQTPLWVSARLLGAMLYAPESFTIDGPTGFIAASAYYHYTHAELLDGPGHGVDVFAADKHTVIQDFVENVCWAESYPTLEAVATNIGDLYDATFSADIGLPAAITGTCQGNARCETWMARYAASRPHLTGAAAQVPILIAYGMLDDTLTPTRMACAVERLVVHDGADVTGCVDPNAVHDNIHFRKGDYLNQWIAWKTLGETEPAACEQDLSTFVTGDGTMVIDCEIPPPND